MHPDLSHVLLTEEEIQLKVAEMGRRLAAEYAGKNPLLIGILKGAVLFCADLFRALDVPASIDFMAVSSYGASTKSSGVTRIMKDLDQGVEGRHVLLVEDIVDTGLTLRYLREYLGGRGPASLAIAVLLDKPSRRQAEVKVDYVGFEIPDEFVVGYGLDFAEQYRNLPYIGVLKPETYQK
ncbi:MAG: hypoxanthine phosphoribosyltransferase [Symbiobacteriia bacterium]